MRILVSFALTLLLIFPTSDSPTHGHKAPGLRLLRDTEFFQVLSDHIGEATHEIVVSMYLFKSRPESLNRANMILTDLVAARQRGVRVRVLLEKTGRRDNSLNRENLATSKRLRQNGVEVRFDSPDTTTHTKAIVIDKRFVFIGSHNLTHSALFYNHELSVLIDNRDLARNVVEYLEKLET